MQRPTSGLKAPGAGKPATGALLVRDAAEADRAAIQPIYAHHVLHGLATFEIVPPTVVELVSRRAATRQLGLP